MSGEGQERNISGKNRQNRKTGFSYEKKAAEYLQKKGFQILQQNFYTKTGELDIIARDGKYLVFVEVKYRATAKEGHPLEAVDMHKRNRIRRAAQIFLLRYGYGENTPCRFDVVGILGDEITHIENAFE